MVGVKFQRLESQVDSIPTTRIVKKSLMARIIFTSITITILYGQFAMAAAPPKIWDVKAENYFFGAARPGDRYTITLKATRTEGVKSLSGFIWSPTYIGGRGERMCGVSFEPTGPPDQFRAQFIVPAHQSEKPDLPLPAGNYRLEITSGLGANGRYAHDYIEIHSFRFEPDPGPPFEVKFGGSNIIHAHDTPRIEFDVATRGENRRVDYEITVLNYFGQQVGEPLSGIMELKQYQRQSHHVRLPRVEDIQQYRVWLKMSDHKSDHKVRAHRRLLPERSTGLRRERFLDDATWQILPVTQLTDDPPPDSADWYIGAKGWSGRRLNQHFDESVVAVWLRCEIDAQPWLVGKRCEIFFDRLGFLGTVYLNGMAVSDPVGGHEVPISIDATKAFRPGQRNVLHVRIQDIEPTILPSNPKYQGYDGNSVWPHSPHWHGLGLGGAIRLRIYPIVSIADVFVMPSVTEGRLKLRSDLRNDGTSAGAFQIFHEVIDVEGQTVLQFDPQSIQLGVGEQQPIQQFRLWDNPQLWSPKSPYLYRLRTQLKDRDGKVIDELSTRFGFREFRADGRHLLFNGKRFKAKLSASTFGHGGSHEECYELFGQPGGAVGYVRQDKEKDWPRYLRWHLRPAGAACLDVADELGAMIELEAPTNIGNKFIPEHWDNFANIVRRLYREHKNRPAVIVWSIDNEILIVNNVAPACYDTNKKRLIRIAKMLERLDPTRPIVSNGGGDIDGTWNTINLHYARKWFKRPDLPVSAFWLEFGKTKMQCDQSWPGHVDWDRPIPIFMGEDGIGIEARPPHDFASVGGEEMYRQAFQLGAREGSGLADDQAFAMFIEAYRDAEVPIVTNAMGGTGGPACARAHLPVRSFVKQRFRHFFSGQTYRLDINLHHDYLSDGDVTLDWKLAWLQSKGDGRGTKGNKNDATDRGLQPTIGRKIAGNEQTYRMVPGELKRFVLDFSIPAVNQPTPLVLEHRVLRNGNEMFNEVLEFTAYPRKTLSVQSSERTFGLLDPRGRTAPVLRAAGLEFIPIANWEDKKIEQIQCLIVGEDNFPFRSNTEPFWKAANRIVERGGVVICMAQGTTMYGHALGGGNPTICWNRHPAHPILAGITSNMLRWWRDDYYLAYHGMRKIGDWGYRPLIEDGHVDHGGGLTNSALQEIVHSSGSIILCQLRLVEKLETEPVASLLLENLLNFGISRQPRSLAKLRLVASPTSTISKTLTERVDVGLPLTDELDAEVWIVDANVPAKTFPAIADQLAAGETVLLVGLTPQNLPTWKSLLPDDVKLLETGAKYAVGKHDHPLLAGISPTDLWWAQGSKYSGAQHGAPAIRFAIQCPADEAVELVETGGLMLFEQGEGRLLIDQMCWYDPGVNRNRATHYVMGLLLNLAESAGKTIAVER